MTYKKKVRSNKIPQFVHGYDHKIRLDLTKEQLKSILSCFGISTNLISQSQLVRERVITVLPELHM